MVGSGRRLRRRRAITRRLTVVLAAAGLSAIIVVLAVGAVSQISPASSSYNRTVDRGFVALATPLVAQSNSSGTLLATLLRQGPGLDRGSFFSDLDSLASQTEQQVTQLQQISPPSPALGRGSDCDKAFADRARAASSLRAALEGVLGGPTGVANGAGDQASTVSAMQAVGSSLVSDDALWAQCRSSVRKGPGSARLPVSTWVQDPSSWAPSAISDFVAAIVGSPTLVATHALTISDAVTTPAGSHGASGLGVPATTSLGVQVVLVDTGNVDETSVGVVASLTASGAQGAVGTFSPGPVSPRGRVDVSAGRSIALNFPSLTVSPGASYNLRVSATSPAAPGSPATILLPLTISQAISTTTVYASVSTVAAGGRVTYLATVAASVGGLPEATGTVAFSDDATPISGCGTQPVSHGRATCTVSYPAAGVHAITAAYTGDPTRSASVSASFIEKISNASTGSGTPRAAARSPGVT